MPTFAELPNFFYVAGPGSGLGHSSMIFVAECQIAYNMDCIRKLLAANRTDRGVR